MSAFNEICHINSFKIIYSHKIHNLFCPLTQSSIYPNWTQNIATSNMSKLCPPLQRIHAHEGFNISIKYEMRAVLTAKWRESM